MEWNKWFNTSLENVIAISLSVIGIYIAVIAFTRIFGKRSFSKMSSFDFAMTVGVGSLIATTALSKDVSLLDGLVGLFVIYLSQLTAAFCRRWKPFQKAIDNRPLLLMIDGQILDKNLRAARVSQGDLLSKLRENGVMDILDVKAVIFETTGNISVLYSSEKFKTVHPLLLKDVEMGEYSK